MGNVFIADTGNNAIREWIAASNTVTTLVSSGLFWPNGVALDRTGNVFTASTGDNTIKEWMAASNTVKTLLSSGLTDPCSVAVDGAGNVYIADGTNNTIVSGWQPATPSPRWYLRDYIGPMAWRWTA